MFHFQKTRNRAINPVRKLSNQSTKRVSLKRRKGSALVFSVFLVAGLLVVSAIAIDFGHISVSRSEVKRTADAAAMSACWELFDGVVEGSDVGTVQGNIGDAAAMIASKNIVSARAPTLDTGGDVEIGYYDRNAPGELDTSDPSKFNAVRVHVRQTEANQSAIPLFFGSVTGRQTQSLQVDSTAALFKTISGFYPPKKAGETLGILPITLDEETWELVIANKTKDVYKCSGGPVESGSDGYCECTLYPEGAGSSGNRGTIDLGSANNSTSDIERQILNGMSYEDYTAFGRTLAFDSTQAIHISGDTGISAAIKDELNQIIGQPRIIPIFRSVTGEGDNAVYEIVKWEGVRILSVRLTGPIGKKHLTIQPCPMVAKYAVFNDESVPESSFLYTPVMLVE